MTVAAELLRRAEAAQSDYVKDLAELVSIDSGSLDADGVNRVADWVSARLERLGFSIERQRRPATTEPQYGDVLIGRRRGTGVKRIVLFAHMDTVFARGDAAARPFTLKSGRAHGPGVTDDKAGITAGLHAAQHLIASGNERFGELVLVFTPDEEVGSPVGGPAILQAVTGADAALCLECARENGDIVTARKGVVDLELEVRGLAAHSGIEPERGAHAGLEAAHLTVFLHSLADRMSGVSVNVGVLRAGDRLNIVPDRAQLHVEVRATAAASLDATIERIRERVAAPIVAGTTVEILHFEHCPPMEPTAASERIAAQAVAIADRLGFTIETAHTGGVSDANRVAALGIPTLDGLGPVGGGDHSPGEWLDLDSVPRRVAMLATLIDTLGAADGVVDLAPAAHTRDAIVVSASTEGNPIRHEP
ncbi:M20 family metallopeptidase [Glaciibacter psychrotolerans]|uniref:Glutamate carboxypeptidase n=1 Tax=Glaciibacter psychrotolerans TaxID=670054 RepID=A0A7Z0EBJ3_9MICO|nr:M20 family metallopeptidase [Leifsonia psychrotolerans]NYJ18579.1 glutamate carboxypeptidase [Leifsonia psychrotolerans]